MLLFVWMLPGGILVAQADTEMTWWNPESADFQVIEGKTWRARTTGCPPGTRSW